MSLVGKKMATSVGDIVSLIGQADNYASRMNISIAEAENAYNLKYRVSSSPGTASSILGIRIPPETPVHTPSTGPAIVDHFVDQVRVVNPVVSVGPRLRGSKGTERREKLERFGSHVLSRIDINEDEPLWRYLVFQLSLFGASVVRVLFDETLWPTESDNQKESWPFLVRAIHPSNVYVPSGSRWPYSWVIEKQSRYLHEVKADYPDWTPASEYKASGGFVDVYLYWDKDEYVLIGGNTEMARKPNMLGIPPYVWGFSGLGYKAKDGDPDSQAAGVLRHVISELESEVRLRTTADSLWQRTVYATLVVKIPDE